MRKATIVLVTVAMLLVVMTSSTIARSYSVCPNPMTENPCFYGFETDLQIGMPSPSFFTWDVGFLTQGYFNLGAGLSLASIETRGMIGVYSKLGILTFDILKGRWMLNPQSNEWYFGCKLKVPLRVIPMCETASWPLSGGFQYVESFLNQSYGYVYLQEFSPFVGIDVPFYRGYAELWIELQFPHSHKIIVANCERSVIDKESLQFEFGFSFCR